MIIRPKQTRSGSVLVITLLICAILGITIISYLDLTSSQNRAVMRSQQWNSVVPIMEAGVEEALSQLRLNTNDLSANGWTPGNNTFTKTRFFGAGRFTVAISNVNPPVIYSTGYLKIPMSTGDLSRVLRVTTTNSYLFARGLVARGDVTFVGNNTTVDSFDSLGMPIDWNIGIRKANGTVAAISGAVSPEDISVQNANIYGSILVSPYGSYSAGAQGRVGDLSWAGPGIQPGAAHSDLNVSIPDVIVPAGLSSALPVPGNNTITTSGNYTSLGITSPMTVRSNVVATVLVNGNMSANIVLETGARLTIYMNGDTLSLTGNEGMNQALNSNALNLLIYGTSRFTSFRLSGNSKFKGMLYAPQVAFSAGGSGNNVVDFAGAAVVGTAGMNGHFNFHYDEVLGRQGPQGAFVMTGWTEL